MHLLTQPRVLFCALSSLHRHEIVSISHPELQQIYYSTFVMMSNDEREILEYVPAQPRNVPVANNIHIII